MSQMPGPYDDMMGSNQTQRRGMPMWGWVLLGIGGALLLSCIVCIGGLAILGANSPDTAIYAANEVPNKYLDEARNLNLVEDDERVLWFYSDALMDVKDGMYFVTDRKLVIYNQTAGGQPETVIAYEDIADAQLRRDTSFLIDSTITVTLKDGSVFTFPVSSEQDRDVAFHETIIERIEPE